ncbi:MAG: M15 family metallopeptidase [Lachnospiraceae bacterium]|nr:M15 family metallopeptidase [Lachnospiraceae bacterium]
MGNQKKKRRRRRRIHPLFYMVLILLLINLILVGKLIGMKGALAEYTVSGASTAVLASVQGVSAGNTVDCDSGSTAGRTAWTAQASGNDGTAAAQASESDEALAAQAKQIYEDNEDLLVLVNKEHAVPDNYGTDLKLLNNGRFYVAKSLYDDLVKMLDDADEQGYDYYLVCGYRNRDYQQGLVDNDVKMYMEDYGLSYQEALAKTYEQVMPAGYSEHETGLAMDITAAGNVTLDESQDQEPAIIWLKENGWKYGFILRYPEDKEDVTGISYEPWHFHYVGREAAEFMHEHDLTLEEFYEYLEV